MKISRTVLRGEWRSNALFLPDSEANVGRQLFAHADIGTNKAITLVNRINAYFGLDWIARPSAFTSPAYFDNLVISCVDTRKARKEIWEGIHKESLYWLDTGNGNHTGQAILGHTAFHRASWPMRNKHVLLPTAYDLFPELLDDRIPDDDTTPSCSLAIALEKQDLMVNQTVATHALELVWQLYRNRMLSHHGFFFDCSAFRLTPLPVDKEIWKRYLQQAKNYQHLQQAKNYQPFSTRTA